jgi:hypothetical protein
MMVTAIAKKIANTPFFELGIEPRARRISVHRRLNWRFSLNLAQPYLTADFIENMKFGLIL